MAEWSRFCTPWEYISIGAVSAGLGSDVVQLSIKVSPVLSNWSYGFCFCSHHLSVSASNIASLLPSSRKYLHGWLINNFSSKSRSSQMFSRPRQRDRVTCMLNGVSVPVGGVPISIIAWLII